MVYHKLLVVNMTAEPGSMHAISANVGNQMKIYMHHGEVTITVACTDERVTWVGMHGIESLRREEHDSIMSSLLGEMLTPCYSRVS